MLNDYEVFIVATQPSANIRGLCEGALRMGCRWVIFRTTIVKLTL